MTQAMEKQILIRLDKLERTRDRHANRLQTLELEETTRRARRNAHRQAGGELTADDIKGAMEGKRGGG